jgi:predicted nucleotidyltransferase
MIQLLEKKADELQALCERYHVRTLEAFGSAVRESGFDAERSDLDFLVDFCPDRSANAADRYFGFRSELETLFGRSVDLVMVGALKNRFFIESVNETRRLLYAA